MKKQFLLSTLEVLIVKKIIIKMIDDDGFDSRGWFIWSVRLVCARRRS